MKEPFINNIQWLDLTGSEIWNELEKLNFPFAYEDSKTKKIGMIDRNGQILIQPELSSLKVMDGERGLLAFSVGEGKKEKFGIMNQRGAIVKEPFADQIDGENVMLDGKVGRLEPTGEILVPAFAFDIKQLSASGYYQYQLEEQGKWGVMDSSGNIIAEPFASDFDSHIEVDDRFIWFHDGDNSLAGTLNLTTSDQVKPFASEYTAHDSSFYVYKSEADGLSGLLNQEGQVVKEPFAYEIDTNNIYQEYDNQKKAYTGKMLMTYSDKEFGELGLINEKGEIIQTPFAKSIDFPLTPESSGTFRNYQEGALRVGILDSEGKIVKEPFAKEISPFYDGVAWYSEGNDTFGLIKDDGEIIKDSSTFRNPTPESDVTTRLSNKACVYFEKEKGRGLINTAGDIVKEAFAVSILPLENRELFKFQLESDGLYGIINYQGEIIEEPFAYDIIEQAGDFFSKYTVNEEKRYGIINEQGEVVEEAELTKIHYLPSLPERVVYSKDGKTIIMKYNGEKIEVSEELSSIEEHSLADGSFLYEYQIYDDKENEKGLINIETGHVMPLPMHDIKWPVANTAFYDEVMPYQQTEMVNNMGLISSQGVIIKEPFARLITPFNEQGIAEYYWDEKGVTSKGRINKEGKILTEFGEELN